MTFNNKNKGTEENHQRDTSIDSLRGFAILLVVLGHSIQYSGIKFDDNIFFKIIYSFHMPLFMFISGYVSLFSTTKIISGFKKRSILLLAPFFSWAVVNYLIKSMNSGSVNWIGAKTFFLNLIHSPDDNGLWFLWVLFMISGILFILKLIKVPIITGIIITFILLNLIFVKWPGINFLGLSLLKYHLLYFLIGIVFYKTRSDFKSFYKVSLYACCILFPLFVIFWHRSYPPSFITNLSLNSLAIKLSWLSYQYICGLLGIGVSILFIENLGKVFNYATVFLRKIGLITLEIYATHFYFLSIGLTLFTSCAFFYKITLTCMLTLATSILVIYLMKKSAIISLIFFGQTKKKHDASK